ncbi:MAG: sulfur carrier protein ThiS adenylyltransferase ThiF [Spirochaetota bacterium]|nr:sulfur carrier protein ThiS adenylyltransferase ThiF [Spirochaetota bacterium]
MIRINERQEDFKPGLTLLGLRDKMKPDADIVIYNGFPVPDDRDIQDGDEMVFIKRGETPSREELESLMVSRHSPGVHEKVKNASVGIAGVGGLGSAIAIALARLGIGRLVLADFDVVEPSNLNRQQYFVHQIGEKKVEAMKENLERINPYVTVECHCVKLDSENLPRIYGEVDVLVEAFDRPDMKSMLVNSYFESYPDKYVVAASGLAGSGNANDIQTRLLGRRLYLVGDRVSAAEPGRGLMAPRVGVAAHHQANKVLEIILGGEL